jgi:hypothetical protein
MVKLVAIVGLSMILATAAAASAKPSGGTSEPQYCIQFEAGTGSRVARTECRTKSEWKKLGVDVDDLLQK